jgi:hypothetical protein
MSGTSQPSFERADILKPLLDHLEINQADVLHNLQQKVLGEMVARGREAGVAAQHAVSQALQDAITTRSEEILSQLHQVFDGAYIEHCENLAEQLKTETLSRLEAMRDAASLELQRSIGPIGSSIDLQSLPSPTALSEHLVQIEPRLFAQIDLICTKLEATQTQRLFLKKGEVFGGNRALRAIFEAARESIDIIDAYLGPKVFDLLEVSSGSVQIRLITDNLKNSTKQAYQDFAQQFGRIDFRRCDPKDIHARYIILDHKTVLHIGHSLQDLGKSDSSIDPASPEVIARFEELWSKSTPV